ncbi:MAG: STAS domain-containing protein [Acidobacteriota bacterium]|nr:STAS domain-containing protein [Acidobacteriota bacterium]
MNLDTGSLINVHSRREGNVGIIYAGDYLNKLSGERIEREAQNLLEAGCGALVVSFRETQFVNSIGVSILLGIIDAAKKTNAELVFTEINKHTEELFSMLGLSRHVRLEKDETAALNSFQIAGS